MLKDKRISLLLNKEQLFKFRIKLESDNITQSNFLRFFIDSYLNESKEVLSLVEKIKLNSGNYTKAEQRFVKKMISEREEIIKQFGLNKEEVESIFDLIEEEHPDL